MNKSSLRSMLNRNKMVYIKPDMGSFGKGVMRVEKLTTSKGVQYRYQHRKIPRAFGSYDKMYRSIRGSQTKKHYLVQKGIHLLKFHNLRFDIRVMVQMNTQGEWETTGLIGRLAHPQKIVTNYHSGGTPRAVEDLLQTHLKKPKLYLFKRKLSVLGRTIANHMQRTYPGIKELGVDVAVDRTMKPWILEVNTRPDPYIFKRLKDKTIYRRIMRYARAYGRIR